MKKLLKSALLFAAAGSALSLQALPVGNPAEPSLLIDGTMWEGASGDPCDPCATWCDAISIRAGFYGDYVFDRILKVDVNKTISGMAAAPTAASGTASNTTVAADRSNFAYGKHLQDAEWCTNAAYLALNIWDRFDVFCTLGASNGYFKASSDAFNLVGLIGLAGTDFANQRPNVEISQGIVELYTDTAFSWSVGARGALWECGCATLGAEFQYAQSNPKIEMLNVTSSPAQFMIHKPRGYKGTAANFPLPVAAGTATATDTKSATVKYHEWQVGLALSYRLNMLVPYIGVNWSRATFDADTIRIAQPKLASAILNLTTWNPTLLGVATTLDTSNKYADFMQIVSMQINKMKSRKACGIAVGATLIDADKWSITGEARLIDERAAHINAQFRF
ncbi:outer membrane protein OmpA [Chlamydia felis Fe/C-56]|uniref:Major outer membrane porin n=4 Tax=Chlamydia TaxID=810 RepID=MOMPP_CHLPS|nr:porin [Chlamydia felis]Q00087.1 RecName: Full=Major outer membrane porin; Short=MOMP; Flags: Precursor [Chlamydia psittaci]BAE81730.1 outer membrane protein OmpA [Chlamydia felis Fe/C-56]CAA43409.1 major outer membrane protein [Chlamydia felis]